MERVIFVQPVRWLCSHPNSAFICTDPSIRP